MSALAARIENMSIPVPEAGCWLWTGSVSQNGYGRINVGNKNSAAHRMSYSAFIGAIPDGLLVCHKCDTPTCVNPGHLFLGTPADNANDMHRKGRGVRPAITHCKHGHPATPENRRKYGGRGTKCGPCANALCREYRRDRIKSIGGVL